MPDPSALAPLHAPTVLLLASVVMGSAALILGLCGLGQRVYRGHGWWVAAMALAALGGLLQWLRAAWPGAAVPAHLLLMAWPVLVATGLRRFHNRERLPGSGPVDALGLALAYLAWLAAWSSPPLEVWRPLVFGLGFALLHLHAALLARRLARRRRSPMLGALSMVLLLQGLVPLAAAAAALAGGAGPVPGRTLLAPAVVLPNLVAMLFTVYLWLALMHERTERDLRETQRRLRVLADTDMLTQVPNRRHFEELAGAVLDGGRPAVLLLFDIDHFKAVNDTHGHAVGDAALQLVARCARETLRGCDVLGRVGGDEFMLLLPDAGVDDALRVADRLTRRVDDEARAAGALLSLSLSFGVVAVSPGEALAAARHRADLALYEAKRQGRRRAVPAHDSGPRTVFGESRSFGLTLP